MKNKAQSGITLIELMVAVVVIAIILALASPDYNTVKLKNEAINVTGELSTALQLARTMAVTRGLPSGFCASSDQATCSGSWSDGWIIFVDENRNNTMDGVEAPVQVYKTGTENFINITSTHPAILFFRPSGGAIIPASIDYQICVDSGATYRNREIYVSPVGSIILSQDDNGDGIHQDLSGASVSCP